MKCDVMGGFRARVIYQKKEDKMRVKMVVVVLSWEWRCGGVSRIYGAAARVCVGRERERDEKDGVFVFVCV